VIIVWLACVIQINIFLHEQMSADVSEKTIASIIRVGGQALPAACILLVSCLTYASPLKMEAIKCSEILVDSYRTVLNIGPAVRTSNPITFYMRFT
jgi:hypothetical protein